MILSISIQHHVEFYETDMAGLVHFSNYFRWMESAETAFFKSLGLPIIEKDQSIISGWPKVNVSCSFIAPLRFQDCVEIELTLREIKNSTLSYDFQFFKIENGQRTKIATAEMTSVYAKFDILSDTFSACIIDGKLRDKIQSILK